MHRKKIAIGVDIGGSHISSAAANLEKVELIKDSLYEENVDNKAGSKEILEKWALALNKTINAVLLLTSMLVNELLLQPKIVKLVKASRPVRSEMFLYEIPSVITPEILAVVK